MNIAPWIGFIISGMVLFFGVFHATPNPKLFLDPHALILVCGGTLAAAFISLDMRKMMQLVDLFFFGLLLKRKKSPVNHARQILSLAVRLKGKPFSEWESFKFTHPFAREAYHLARKDYLSSRDFMELLLKRNDYFKQLYKDDAKVLTALGKFPPAFGLLGATTGMIAMMTNLGDGDHSMIGPAMAVALVATFWGIALANFVILPMADYAGKAATEDQNVRQMIAEGMLLLRERAEPVILMEKLASHLSPLHRADLKAGFAFDESFSEEEKTLLPRNIVKMRKSG